MSIPLDIRAGRPAQVRLLEVLGPEGNHATAAGGHHDLWKQVGPDRHRVLEAPRRFRDRRVDRAGAGGSELFACHGQSPAFTILTGLPRAMA